MFKKKIFLITLAIYTIGILAGYLIFDEEYDSEPIISSSTRSEVSYQEENSVQKRQVIRRTKQRILPPTIVTDKDGNFHIPVSMEDRLGISLIRNSEVNTENLAILGLDDFQIVRIQNLVSQTLKEWVDREKSVAKHFTDTEDEIVILVPGSRPAAENLQKNLIDGISSIAPDQSKFLEKRLIVQVGNETMDFGRVDYYFRVSRSLDIMGIMAFESIKLYDRANREKPELNLGDSFMDYKTRYRFDSSRIFGGVLPPVYVEHLIHKEQYEHLLKPKR